MSRDLLSDLLRDADASAPPPPAPRGVAERVRARSRARDRRRRATALVVLPVGVATVAALLLRDRAPVDAIRRVAASQATTAVASTGPTTAAAPPVDPTAALDEARRLQSEASIQLAVARGLNARRELRRRASERAGSTDLARGTSLRGEREMAALTLLDHADRLRRDLKEVDAALATYRRTVELFPDTAWAAVARRRIEELRPDARGVRADRSLT